MEKINIKNLLVKNLFEAKMSMNEFMVYAALYIFSMYSRAYIPILYMYTMKIYCRHHFANAHTVYLYSCFFALNFAGKAGAGNTNKINFILHVGNSHHCRVIDVGNAQKCLGNRCWKC